MSKYWITPDGGYYEGDFVADGSIPVPQRPSVDHEWDGSKWRKTDGPRTEMLTPVQFWMQLAIDGDEDVALAIIDTLPRPQQILALRAKDYRITDPLLLQLAQALGKNSNQIDVFFRKASKL
jgi:hypothetical protein